MSPTMNGHPLDRPHPSLQPPDEYRTMAQQVIDNAGPIADFLSRCKACGLPTDEREAQLQAQCDFCKAFLSNFYPDHA